MPVPAFSIIIPTYNSGKTLSQALGSILRQKFTDFEIIIVDGVSRDNTLEIIQKAAANDTRIKWVSEKDNGIFDAMNKGIALSNGSWLYFLGSDDFLYDENVLLNVNNHSTTTNASFIYGKVYSPKLKGTYGHKSDGKDILFRNISHQSEFYKREIHEQVGQYKVEYKSFADWHFNIQCFKHPNIQTEYIDLVIATFADGGASSVSPDVFFLRDYLFPKLLDDLHQSGKPRISSLKTYDKWWRLIRSLSLDKTDDITKYSGGHKIPPQISQIVKYQGRMSHKKLLNGYYSKLNMTISFVKSLLS